MIDIDWERTIRLAVSDRKSPVEKALRASEETGKLAQAVLSHFGAHSCKDRNKSKDDIIEGAVGVIQCTVSVLGKVFEEESFPVTKFQIIYGNKLNRWEQKQKENNLEYKTQNIPSEISVEKKLEQLQNRLDNLEATVKKDDPDLLRGPTHLDVYSMLNDILEKNFFYVNASDSPAEELIGFICHYGQTNELKTYSVPKEYFLGFCRNCPGLSSTLMSAEGRRKLAAKLRMGKGKKALDILKTL